MAAPAWATNMTNFWVTATGATTVTSIGTGGAGLGNPETDFFIESTSCISKAAWTNATKGFIIDALGANFTVPTDGAVIFFAKYDAQGSLDTKANGGFQSIIGSASGAYYHYYIGGSNTLAFDSWVPYVIDPNTATVDNTTGSPAGTERWVGLLATLPTTSGPTKGNPIAIDAIRYGRCDVEYTDGDLGNGYNTFSGAEAFANATTRRWGLIQLEGGAYIIQGFHSFGTVATAVDFRDSNKVLFWRPAGNNNLTNDAVSTGFNRMEILNASSNVDWDNIIVQSLGTRARGVFVHTAGTFDAVDCQFIDMDTFTFISTSTLTTTTFRRCNAVTAGSGTFTGCKFINSTAASSTISTDLSDFTDCEFTSDGSNHAVELTSIGTGTMTWSGNQLNNYVAGTAGSPVTPTSTGNEAIYVNVATASNLTINVVNGADIPSIRVGGSFTGSVNVVASTNVTITGLKDNTEVRVMQAGSNTVELAGTDNATTGTTDNRSFSFALASGTSVDIYLVSVLYENIEIYGYTVPGTDATLPQQQRFDRVYLNP